MPIKTSNRLPELRIWALTWFLVAIVAASTGQVLATDSNEKPQHTEIDLMTQAAKILEGARNPKMAEVLKRAVNARQIRKLGNLGKLTAADYEILKAAPPIAKEREALTVAVAEFKREGQEKAATALQALLDQRTKKTPRPSATGAKRSSDIARLEAKLEQIRKQLIEVESELARVKAR